MMARLILFLVLILSFNTSAQQLKKADRFIGEWMYKYDLGVEVWKLSGDELIAESYRKNKFGDSTKVEEIRIRMAGKLLVHEWTTYNVSNDSLIVNSSTFVSTSKKYRFHNVDGVTPYMIQYKFGLFSKRKMKILVEYGINQKPTRFVLERVN